MPLDGYSIVEPLIYTYRLLIFGWWIIVPVYALFILVMVWEQYFVLKFILSVVWRYLIVTVPKDNLRGERYMDQFFTALWSVVRSPNLSDKWLEGQRLMFFSFEIVSVEGNVRFVIRTPDMWRKQVESQIYAQYPDAEIEEGIDYMSLIPENFLDQGYDMSGVEFCYSNSKEKMLPLRIFTDFETKDQVTDPMASFIEYLANLKKGQYATYQLAIRALSAGDKNLDIDEERWRKDGEKLIETKIKKYKNEGGTTMIPQHEQESMKAISHRLGKHAYEVKYRYAHFAKKTAFDKPWAINAGFAPVQQFGTGAQGLKPNMRTMPSIKYFFKDYRERWRKRTLVKAMRLRKFTFGGDALILNTEELATMYHFPMNTVKLEHVDAVLAKKAAAPRDLPVAPLE